MRFDAAEPSARVGREEIGQIDRPLGKVEVGMPGVPRRERGSNDGRVALHVCRHLRVQHEAHGRLGKAGLEGRECAVLRGSVGQCTSQVPQLD